MEKNVRIADENNVIYAATYPKRAKGLIKKGRARFIDENTICMPRPSDITEDKSMTENINTHQETELDKLKPTESKLPNIPEPEKKQPEQTEPQLTVPYLLAQIANIANSAEYLNKAVSELTAIQTGVPGDISGQAKAQALSDVVKCRETTNQQILRMYEKMYGDIRQPKQDRRDKLLDMIEKTANNTQLRADQLDLLLENIQKLYEMG